MSGDGSKDSIKNPIMREFPSGAKRDTDEGKVNYIKSFSPLVLQAYGEFMLKHNSQRDGEKREEDNWKKGFGTQSFMESKMRHIIEGTWMIFDGFSNKDIVDALCAELFNTMGFLHEVLVKRREEKLKSEMLDTSAHSGFIKHAL